jgi:hypothetical protein
MLWSKAVHCMLGRGRRERQREREEEGEVFFSHMGAAIVFLFTR